MIDLFSFQNDAVEALKSTFVSIWEQDGSNLPLVFKAPTGSGKTLIMANFIRGLSSLPNWAQDTSFIWITFSDDLAMQSKTKFEDYFGNNTENKLLTVADLNQGKLLKNDVLFMNWQKVVSRKSEDRLLRRPDDESMHKEKGVYFEDFVENTKSDGRSIVLVIDEAHRNVNTDLASQIIDLIEPKITVHVSATPDDHIELEGRRVGGYVEVSRDDVIEEGLIKESIATQTNEDISKAKNRDLDEVLIDLGFEKRELLKKEFEKIGRKVNPLMLIQLPNDDTLRVESGEKTKEEIVTEYLISKGVDPNRIAKWFDDKKKPEFLEDNDDGHDFLLFKVAAGTGWDCPRAQVLVMFRDIQVEKSYIQTIGRIMRMPEPQYKELYKDSPALRMGYLYTNYNRQEINDNWLELSSSNKPLIFEAKRKTDIVNVQLVSSFVSRVDYGDLSSSYKFQSIFIKSLNKYFGITNDDILGSSRDKLVAKNIDMEPVVTNEIVVDARIKDFDNIKFEFKSQGHEATHEMSRNDVERTFTYLCYQLLKEQTEEKAKVSNIARSWSPLKSALRIWLRGVLGEDSAYNYQVFIADIRKGPSSQFRPAITNALGEFLPILKELVAEKAAIEDLKQAPIFTINEAYYFNEDFEEFTQSLCVLDKAYFRSEYTGRANEISFAEYLESKDEKIDWWFKNQDHGKDYFAVKYKDSTSSKERLFYPDWIIRLKDGRIGILDTKSGFTAENAQDKAEALAIRIQEMGESHFGGILVKENEQWYLHSGKDYSYGSGNLGEGWRPLNDLI